MSDKPKDCQDNPEQSKRFIEIAKELGADEKEEAFEDAFTKIVPSSSSSVPKRSPKQSQ